MQDLVAELRGSPGRFLPAWSSFQSPGSTQRGCTARTARRPSRGSVRGPGGRCRRIPGVDPTRSSSMSDSGFEVFGLVVEIGSGGSIVVVVVAIAIGVSLSLARSGRPMAPRACCRVCCFSTGHDLAVGVVAAPSSMAVVVVVVIVVAVEFVFVFRSAGEGGTATATLCDCRYACMPTSSSAVRIGKRLTRRTLHDRVDVQVCRSVTTESISLNVERVQHPVDYFDASTTRHAFNEEDDDCLLFRRRGGR
jgi:hypothetical protein